MFTNDFYTYQHPVISTLNFDLFCHISQHEYMTIKFRQFQKKIHTCLTSWQTTSGAPIGDLIVAFCTHFIFRKSHERTAPNAEQKFFTDSKTELEYFFYPQAQYEA